jgi:hypothetical protein
MAAKRSELANPNPLAAVPVLVDGVEARRDTESLVQLNRRVPPATGAFGWLARVMGTRRVRINLDERGSFFWDRIDGKRNLMQIAAELQERFGTDVAAARHATVTFTRMLMLRHIIQLRVERNSPVRTERKVSP